MSARADRVDIQVLRGIAVLAVVIFHGFRDVLPKGFLGVDVFLVISGFLITGHIMQGLERGTFSFADFYRRRARRLLPASFSTLIVTTGLALFILSPAELSDFAKQALGMITFSANFVLMFQTNYFAPAAEAKPLLHTWSLSLEEQFYLITPLLLWLTPLRGRPWLLLLGTLASGFLCYLLIGTDALPGISAAEGEKLAFFMLPPRAWELLIGALAAWTMLRRPTLDVPAWMKYGALGVILFACGAGFSDDHPGPDAIISTFATAVILLGRDGWLHDNPLTRFVRQIGDWSYSVYLVHWPLFSFAAIAFIDNPPAPLLALLAAISLALGWLQYTYVEQPFRRAEIRWKSLVPAGVLATLFCVAVPTISNAALPESSGVGLAATCALDEGPYVPRPECRTGEAPTALLWGDSHAMMLAPALKADFVQATMFACAPALGLAQMDGHKYSIGWARDCVGFNDDVLASLDRMPSIRDVILASRWDQIFQPQFPLYADGRVGDWSPIAHRHLVRTIRAIQSRGKRAILVGPTAEADFDVGQCIKRQLAGRIILRPGGCKVAAASVERTIGSTVARLRQVARETGATLVLPSEAMCPDHRWCETIDRGQSLYRDKAHLTDAGAEFVVNRTHLRQILRKTELSRSARLQRSHSANPRSF